MRKLLLRCFVPALCRNLKNLSLVSWSFTHTQRKPEVRQQQQNKHNHTKSPGTDLDMKVRMFLANMLFDQFLNVP